jgi:replication initiation and membrane attachment protein DnaB
MHKDTNILEEQERKLVHYLEAYTTEEVLKEAQNYIPSLRSHSDDLHKLNEMKLPPSVVNTLIYYVLATNNQNLKTYKLLELAELCRKFNIKNTKTAIPFFKQHYQCRSNGN